MRRGSASIEVGAGHEGGGRTGGREDGRGMRVGRHEFATGLILVLGACAGTGARFVGGDAGQRAVA
jgi:hypothetical protein